MTINVLWSVQILNCFEKCKFNLSMNLDSAFLSASSSPFLCSGTARRPSGPKSGTTSRSVTVLLALFRLQVVEPVELADTPLSSPPPKIQCGGSHSTIVVVVVKALKYKCAIPALKSFKGKRWKKITSNQWGYTVRGLYSPVIDNTGDGGRADSQNTNVLSRFEQWAAVMLSNYVCASVCVRLYV